ncbi:MAG: hypothetical protein N4A72_18390 [Bacteroidales bacterium]|jgi:hypothetical protein|nr:hypothetical protein [Bacteroidales bacterium]
MKDLKNLRNAKVLSKKEQQSVTGGKQMPPANCRCFCYTNGNRHDASCFERCDDGSIPGAYPGNTDDCYPNGGYEPLPTYPTID